MRSPVHVLTLPHGSLAAHLAVALDLEANEEGSAVQEEHVLFPAAGVVVRFSVDGSRHGPDSSSSHFKFSINLL